MKHLRALSLLLASLLATGCAQLGYVNYDHVSTVSGGSLLPPPNQALYAVDLGDSYYQDRLELWRRDVLAYHRYLERYILDNRLVEPPVAKAPAKPCQAFVLPPRPSVGRLREVDPTDSEAVIDALVEYNTRLRKVIVQYDQQLQEAVQAQIRACQ